MIFLGRSWVILMSRNVERMAVIPEGSAVLEARSNR